MGAYLALSTRAVADDHGCLADDAAADEWRGAGGAVADTDGYVDRFCEGEAGEQEGGSGNEEVHGS